MLRRRYSLALAALLVTGLAQATACKSPAPTGKLTTQDEVKVKPTLSAAKRDKALSAAGVAATRAKSTEELRAAGMSRTEVAVAKQLALGAMVEMGWDADDTKELMTWTGADAEKLGMSASALKELQTKVAEATASPVRKALDAEPAQKIAAAAGGTFKSADGKLTATIPPGALSRDADVRMVAIPTAEYAVPHVVMPGIRYAVDLGGATLKPDTAITVEVRADARTIDALRAKDAAFTPEKYSLKQAADGGWLMAMPVRGPSSASVPAPAVAPGLPAFSLIEKGGLALPPGPEIPRKAALRVLNAGGQPAYGLRQLVDASGACPDPRAAFASSYGRVAPTSMDEWFRYESEGVFDCASIESACCGLQLLQLLGFQGVAPFMGDCPTTPAETPPPAPAQTPPPATPGPVPTAGPTAPPTAAPTEAPTPAPTPRVANLPARVTWTSDDPAVAGKPAAGAIVRFGVVSALSGPGEVVADAQGMATTFGPIGASVDVQAYTNIGPRSSAPAVATISPGMGPVALTLEKNSPSIEVLVEGEDVAVPAKVKALYSLDGVEASKELTVLVPGEASASVRFSVIVPDDGFHQFVLHKVTAEFPVGSRPARRADAAADAADANLASIQRNGVYRFVARLYLIEGK